MLSINDLQNGLIIVIDNIPYIVLSVKHQHIGRGGSSIQTKLKNVKTGQVLDRNFKPADTFEEAEIEKTKAKFLYAHRDQFWFTDANDPKNRFELDEGVLEGVKEFLKANLEVAAIKFEGKIFSVELPIKVDYKIIEAPPGVKGNTAQGGTKVAVIESGAKISVPLFVNEGDIVKVNTQTGEYVERVEKAK